MAFKLTVSVPNKNFIDTTNWEEHYVKRGDPSKPTYYIIRHEIEIGLFAMYKIFAEHIRYALSKGWIPVVDLQNYSNPYLPPEKLGKENAWEYYFEQPLRIGLEQAYKGKNIILSAQGEVLPQLYESMTLLENRDNSLTEWRMLVKLGLLKVKSALMEEFAAVRQKLFAPTDRVLGVHLRGTDYVALQPYAHPIPPPTEFAASVVVAALQEWQCNKIYLATEDKTIVQIFKQVFGDLCVTFDREYVDYSGNVGITDSRIDRSDDHFLQGKEYMMEMLLLSACNSFISARCSGAVGVMMMAENFEHTYFFNLGRYGVIGLD